MTTTEEPPLLTVETRGPDPEVAAGPRTRSRISCLLSRRTPDWTSRTRSSRARSRACRLEIEALTPQSTSSLADANRTPAENALLEDLQTRLGDLRATFAALTSAASPTLAYELSVIEGAEVATGVAGLLRNTILATILGFALALAAAFLSSTSTTP